MNFATLPRWATPEPGESRASWLAATGRLQPMGRPEWEGWIRAAPDEPERPQAGTCWEHLPDVLGDVGAVAPTWRLHPGQRSVYCPRCYVDDGPQRRWVIRTEWLDARRLTCRVHALPLSPTLPALGEEPGWTRCMAQPELRGLANWLHGWCRWDGRVPDWQRESLWRRDLVRLAVRNWSPFNDHPPAVLAAWELYLWGWQYQTRSPMFRPGEPARLGSLSAAERVGALLLIHRCWAALRGIEADTPLPRLPAPAWEWFLRRWWPRLRAAERARVAQVAAQCTDSARRPLPRRAADSS